MIAEISAATRFDRSSLMVTIDYNNALQSEELLDDGAKWLGGTLRSARLAVPGARTLGLFPLTTAQAVQAHC
jgi:hypothetical protein